ncbi:MAG TPA: fatty acyl-AMP ligase, partial [Longimicrobiaceae bacterium]|nr:fatty acyl-AMP ligase [Longimicrobiaceae bacterium]
MSARLQPTQVAPVLGAPEAESVVDRLRQHAERNPDRLVYRFLGDGERETARITYGELDRRARAVAARLADRELAGERVLLLYPPGIEFIVGLFGCLYAGVIAVPANPPSGRRGLPRLGAIVGSAAPRAALTTGAELARIRSRTSPHLDAESVFWLASDSISADSPAGWKPPATRGDRPALLQYTSGSTAQPKGVVVSHAALAFNERLISTAFGVTEDSVVVSWLPVYHDMGLIGGVLQPAFAGACAILMPPVAFLQRPQRWLQAISEHRGDVSGAPDFAYDLCVRRVGEQLRSRLDLSGWRVAFNGAEPVHAETLDRFAEAFGPCGFRPLAFVPCYGLAEATLFVSGASRPRPPTVLPVATAALEQGRVEPTTAGPGPGASSASAGRGDGGRERRVVGCGLVAEDLRVVIADPETLTPCPPGRVGEIWIAGPSVASGYWDDEGGSRLTFGAALPGDPGPFLRSGDLGWIRDGELFIGGRLKDLIIVRGRNHYPQDLERTAGSAHPSLRPGAGAAFGVGAATGEEAVLVHEVERGLREVDAEEVATAVRAAVADEHQLRIAEVVLIRPGSLPMTTSGKVQRAACRDL